MDAYQFVTQTAQAPIANVVDTNYTVVAKLKKAYLPGIDPMGGIHERLKAVGEAYLATR